MKNCQDIENILPLYSEGLLTDAEKRAVEEHLKDCAACRRELTYLQKAGQLVDGLSPVEEPPWFQQKIMARVRKEADKKNWAQKWFYPLRIKVPLQIAATLVIAVLAVYIYRSGDEHVKEILPGAQRHVAETQKEQAPPQAPRTGAIIEPARAPEKKAVVRKEIKEDKQATGGAAIDSIQKSEVPASKPDTAHDMDTVRAKGLFESKDKALESLQTQQNELAAARAPMVEQERKAADQARPALAEKRESSKMITPAAPQSMAASVIAPPQGRASVRVADPIAALPGIEKILAGYEARNISKHPVENAVTIRAEMSRKNWEDLLAKLKEIGQVQEKTKPADVGERTIIVVIELSGQ